MQLLLKNKFDNNLPRVECDLIRYQSTLEVEMKIVNAYQLLSDGKVYSIQCWLNERIHAHRVKKRWRMGMSNIQWFALLHSVSISWNFGNFLMNSIERNMELWTKIKIDPTIKAEETLIFNKPNKRYSESQFTRPPRCTSTKPPKENIKLSTA